MLETFIHLCGTSFREKMIVLSDTDVETCLSKNSSMLDITCTY